MSIKRWLTYQIWCQSQTSQFSYSVLCWLSLLLPSLGLIKHYSNTNYKLVKTKFVILSHFYYT